MAKWHADLPDVIDPPDNVCFLVEIPNHPDYIAAFHGTYERLSHWWAWQRDPLKQGRLAAARWREAVQATWQNIEEIGDMCPLTINVNCGGGASQCCEQNLFLVVNGELHYTDGTYQDIIDLPGGQIDNGVDAPSTDWINYTEYQAYKCNTAHEYVQDLQNTLVGIGGLLTGFSDMTYTLIRLLLTNNTVSTLLHGLVAAVFIQSTYIEAMISAILGTAEDDPGVLVTFSEVRALLDYDQMVCAIFDAGTAVEARDNLVALWNAAMVTAGVSNTVVTPTIEQDYRRIFRLLTHVDNLEIAFDATGTAETFGGYDCSACAGVQPPNDYGTWTMTVGELISGSGPYVFDGELFNNCLRVNIWFNSSDGATYLSSDTATITAIDSVGNELPNSCGGTPFITLRDQQDNILVDSNWPPSFSLPYAGVGRIQLAGDATTVTDWLISLDWTM